LNYFEAALVIKLLKKNLFRKKSPAFRGDFKYLTHLQQEPRVFGQQVLFQLVLLMLLL
jgi:hypothetical protein